MRGIILGGVIAALTIAPSLAQQQSVRLVGTIETVDGSAWQTKQELGTDRSATPSVFLITEGRQRYGKGKSLSTDG